MKGAFRLRGAVALVLLATTAIVSFRMSQQATEVLDLGPTRDEFCNALASGSSPLFVAASALHNWLQLTVLLRLGASVAFLVWLHETLVAVGKVAPDRVLISPTWATWGAFAPGLNIVAPIIGVADALSFWREQRFAVTRWIAFVVAGVWWFLVLSAALRTFWVLPYLARDEWRRDDDFSSVVQALHTSAASATVATIATAVLIVVVTTLRATASSNRDLSASRITPSYANAPYELLQGLTQIGAFGMLLVGLLLRNTRFDLSPVLIVAGGAQMALSRRFKRATWDQVLRNDPRPPIVLLRPFDADYTQVYDDRVSLEEAIADGVVGRGPFLTVGLPGEWPPRAGAARRQVSHDEWQRVVDQLIRTAGYLVVIVGGKDPNQPTAGGFAWEFERIVAYGRLRDTAIVIPPVDSEGAWKRFISHLSNEVAQALPAIDASNGGVLSATSEGRVCVVYTVHQAGYAQAIANWLDVRQGNPGAARPIPGAIHKPKWAARMREVRVWIYGFTSLLGLVAFGGVCVYGACGSGRESIDVRVSTAFCNNEHATASGFTEPCARVTMGSSTANADWVGWFEVETPVDAEGNPVVPSTATVELAGDSVERPVRFDDRWAMKCR